ncbi:hypothetical protein SI65_06045 [Aspergillus cristatus]|uniref:Uncharacterized protein n=1 Tax=Aspergillus cristatus TaxID=573508 RepID=A0A1E3BB65_ASPCR|nr:hypothetical protein SI65_06045 [Aspergillus cristatus]
MGFLDQFSHFKDSYNEYQNTPQEEYKSKISNELIASAASYEAAKAYEKYVFENGKPDSYDEAKERFAGYAGAFIDIEAEIKGLDFIDTVMAKHRAKVQFQEEHYNY